MWLLLLLLLIPVPAKAQDATFRNVEVRRVVDGDTWDVLVRLPIGLTLEARVRPLDLDCAEPRGDTREQGLRQTEHLEVLLFAAQDHTIELYGVDSFGRWLVRAWAEDVDVIAYMREKGCDDYEL